MKAINPFAAALLIAAGSTAFVVPAHAREKKAEAAGAKFSKGVLAAFGAATKAGEKSQIEQQLAAKDYPGVMTRVRAAEQVADRTPDDNYNIAIFKIQAGQGQKDNALLKEGIEGALASGKVPAEQQVNFEQILGDLAANAKDYPTAMHYYGLVAQAKPNDPMVASNLAKLGFDNRAMPVAQRLAALKQASDVAERANQKPEEFLYAARLQIAYDNKMTADIDPAAQALVKAYPSAKNWENVVQIFRGGKNLDAQTELDAYRLQRAVGALTGEGQYLDYANDAQQRGLPAEAKAVLDEGAAKRVIDVGKPNYLELKRLLVPAKIASDRASLPGLERQAGASSTGRLSRATADGYLSHGEYAKAATLYRAALTKGGENADLVNTRLGIALVMSGDKTGAQAAFGAVTGQPRAALAQYWTIWTTQKA